MPPIPADFRSATKAHSLSLQRYRFHGLGFGLLWRPYRIKPFLISNFYEVGSTTPDMKRPLATAATVASTPPYAVADQLLSIEGWPQRPDGLFLNETIPLFFVARDKDGFWIARNADFASGGKFFFKHSALRFAGYYNGSAIMMLTGAYSLDARNTGNRFAKQLRLIRRLIRDIASKFNTLFAGAVKPNSV